MLRDELEPPEPPYGGSFATIRPDGPLYIASIEPPMPGGTGAPQTYSAKSSAWSQCLWWCEEFKLPFRNYCDGKVGPRGPEK